MASLKVGEFLDQVEAHYLAAMPADQCGKTKRVWSLLQVSFGNPRVHFEVWPQRKTGRIELGLHFESERAESYAWAERMSGSFPTILSELGPNVELEEWTASWARIHETIPLSTLTMELADEVANRLQAYVQVLVPLMRLEGIPIELAKTTTPSTFRSQVKRRRRRKVAPAVS